ncbi:MAG: hypothetical protein JWN15_3045, partial [Firmicutes bacterium]|nr:hypothetical protein [Bacillota bacterium]
RRKLNPATRRPSPPAQRPRPWLRWLPAAAALLLAAGGLLTAGSPSAQAALQRLLHVVPGFGITETRPQTLLLAEPVTVQGSRGKLTVTALISTVTFTELHFRIDGLSSVKPDPATMDQEPVRAALLLPDGTRLAFTSATSGVGLNDVQGTLSFPALSESVRTATLELSPMHGLTDPYTAPLKLVDAASAGLTEAVAGGWSSQRNGVMMGAPYAAFEQSQITLSLEAALTAQTTGIRHVGGLPAQPVLTDNLGNTYPLVPEASLLWPGSARGLSATYAGPVHAGATALRLTVDAVQVVEEGTARLRVPLDKLPVGKPAALNQELKLGARRIVVRSVTRLAADQFALDLDLGPEQNGAILQTVSVTPYQTSGGGQYKFDPATQKQASDFVVSYTPQGNYFDVQITRPTVEITGPWQIDLPVK